MLRSIIESSLQFRLLVAVIAVVVMFLGITQFPQMPVDVLPEFQPPTVEVQTEALGLAAVEVESLLTVPLEELLSGLPGLETISSTSVPSLSSIVLVFQRGTDLMHARQLVRERLGLTHNTLPNVTAAPTMLQPTSATNRVMMIGLSSNQLSPIDMSVLARWNIRPRLMGVPGVANVSIWGKRRRQLQVQVDPEQLRAHGVRLDQVIRSAGNAMWFSPLDFLHASYPGSGGWIDTPQQRIGVRHVLPISTAQDLARVSVDGAPLTLGDLGEVVENHPPLIGEAVLNEGPGLLLVIEKFPGANTLEVTRGVDTVLAAMKPGLPGLQIDTHVFRAATFIEQALANLGRSLAISALLILLVLGAFFASWRAALVAAAVIPLSLMAAIFVLYLRGAALNMMVLAGLAVALVVVIDDAIIDIHNLARRRLNPATAPTPRAAVIDAALEMRSAAVFATLILLLIASPLLSLGGEQGAFFQPLVISYALALLASMLVALVVTPALSLIVYSASAAHPPAFVAWLQRRYDGGLTRLIQYPAPVLFAAAIIVAAGLASIPFLQPSLAPSLQEPGLVIRWEGAPGASHPEMTRLTNRARDELRAIPGVQTVNAHIGRAVLGDQVVGMNSAALWIGLAPNADPSSTLAAINETILKYPGVVRNVQSYVQERLYKALTPPDDAVVVRVYGPDLDVLRTTATSLGRSLGRLEGIADWSVDRPPSESNIAIKVDLARASQHGLVPGDIRRAAATLVAGLEVGSLFEQQKVFDVVVWSTPDTRKTLSDVNDLLIDTPNGGHVRLADVAEIRLTSTPSAISREANSRYLDVRFAVSGRSPTSVATDIQRTLPVITFPLEYHPEVVGHHSRLQAAQIRTLSIVVAAVLGIFLLLHAALQSWRLAFLSFLTIPTALVGGILALAVGSRAVSLGSLLGFAAIFALATRNAILLLNHYQHLQARPETASHPDLIVRGSRDRLAPTLMTALATGLALLPFLIAGDIPGHEILRPMAVVILGGLVTSTLLHLFILPLLYLQSGFGRRPAPQPEPVTPADLAPGFEIGD